VTAIPVPGADDKVDPIVMKLRTDRTSTSLPVILENKDGYILGIKTLHWAPKPDGSVNSRGGSA
jgi:hypothetical protein